MTTPPKSFNPWPAALVSVFVLFSTFLLLFVVFVAKQPADLVRRDYYEEEVRFQKHLDRLRRTESFGDQVAVRFEAREHRIVVRLPRSTGAAMASGSIHLYRPSDASADQTVPLTAGAEGVQHVDATRLRPGLWKVRVELEADGREYFFDRPIVVPRRSSS